MSPMRCMSITPRPGLSISRPCDLLDELEGGAEIFSTGFCEVRYLQAREFRLFMGCVDCGTLYEVGKRWLAFRSSPGAQGTSAGRAGEREGNLGHGQALSVSPCKDVRIKAILRLPHRVLASHSHRHPPGQMSGSMNCDVPDASAGLRSRAACSRPFTRSATSTTAPSASTSLNCSAGWILYRREISVDVLLHSIG
jgi:hypothetical protein